jgi:acetyl esterase/lipase
MSPIRMEESIVVSRPEGRDLKVDIFHPASASGPVPGLLFLPGGGWRTADRTPLKDRYGVRMAQRGLLCVGGEYRVMDEAPWPAQVQDVKAIIRWMRANSGRLGIDPSLIVVGGKSAGGHLALLAAGTAGVTEFEGEGGAAGVSSEVAAAVAVAPVSDIAEYARTHDMQPLFGHSPSMDDLNSANPPSYVRKDYPPTLLAHGTADQRVPHSMTLRMYQALEGAGVPVDLHLYAGQDHSFDQDPQFCEAIADAIALFIARYVPAQAGVAAT